MWRLGNGTVDSVTISKMHHDKRMNECTIGTMNTRWKKTKNTFCSSYAVGNSLRM